MLRKPKAIYWVAAALAAFSLLVVGFVDPVAQDPAYHQFADQRRLLGVANFLNVVSNLPFLVIGWIGVRDILGQRREGFRSPARTAFLIFFAGIFLLGIGSSYYHLAPDNPRLVWDRLPLSIAFMALFVAVVIEYVDAGTGKALLLPLLTAGCGSVLYWYWSETRGEGDLRFYGLTQFLSLITISMIVLTCRTEFTRGGDIWVALLYYGFAKLAEFGDRLVYAAAGVISGHSLKHLLAAYAAYRLYRMLRLRERLSPTASGV